MAAARPRAGSWLMSSGQSANCTWPMRPASRAMPAGISSPLPGPLVKVRLRVQIGVIHRAQQYPASPGGDADQKARHIQSVHDRLAQLPMPKLTASTRLRPQVGRETGQRLIAFDASASRPGSTLTNAAGPWAIAQDLLQGDIELGLTRRHASQPRPTGHPDRRQHDDPAPAAGGTFQRFLERNTAGLRGKLDFAGKTRHGSSALASLLPATR